MTAQKVWVADGSQTDFYVTFPYIDRPHVKVEVDETGTGANYRLKTDPTDYEFESGGLFVSFNTTWASGTLVRLTRETPRDLVVSFTDGRPVSASDLDTAHKQQLYITQEVEDKLGT